ncbi:MAG TPA: hypothetical protein VGJ84_06020 [Polyangiaceae bacterium]|jgi:uncharacterized membrane protein
MLSTLLIVVHVAANLLWVGSIVSVGVVAGLPLSTPSLRGQIALALYRRLAAPSFGISFLSGLGRLSMNARFYLWDTHYLQAKLGAVFALIALHHALGARVRRMATGAAENAGHAPKAAAGVLVLASIAAFFALAKPF